MSEKGKEAGIAVTAEELARINRFAKKELRAEEVYTFAVKLCDNEVDRDFERFDRAALESSRSCSSAGRASSTTAGRRADRRRAFTARR